MDVRDVVEGYLALLSRGHPGETYNLAAGRAVTFGELFPHVDRASSTRMRGWCHRPILDAMPGTWSPMPARYGSTPGGTPRSPLEQTISDLIDAQAH